MNYSLSEVESVSKQAVRAAGYAWGLAEDAGKATRFLCQHDIDGCAVLARCLEPKSGFQLSNAALLFGAAEWSAANDVLCPLIAGPALSDLAYRHSSTGVRIQRLLEPAMILLHAARTAQQLNTTVSLLWPTTRVATDGWRLSVSGQMDSGVQSVTVEFGTVLGKLNKKCTRAEPAVSSWMSLNSLAHQLYAPATDASRISGAGAGLSDND